MSATNRAVPILLVDDSATVVKILRGLLNSIGFDNVDHASDCMGAMELIAHKKYGLIISDWNMGNLSGFDLLQKVRADRFHALTPFIMVTSEMSSENVIAAKHAGVSGYLIKPFNADALRRKIDAIFSAHSAALLERVDQGGIEPDCLLV